MRTLPARGCRQRESISEGNTGTHATADSEALAGDQEAADTKAAEEARAEENSRQQTRQQALPKRRATSRQGTEASKKSNQQRETRKPPDKQEGQPGSFWGFYR